MIPTIKINGAEVQLIGWRDESKTKVLVQYVGELPPADKRTFTETSPFAVMDREEIKELK